MSTLSPDRRTLLLAGSTGLALTVAPGWISKAFAQQEQRTPATRSPLTQALERATAIGKPVMAILVPEESLRAERGRLWGDLFGFAPEAAMADFALCEWTCASVAELSGTAAELKGKLGGEAIAVLIETDRSTPRTRIVSFRLGDLAAAPMKGYPIDEIQKRAAELAQALQLAILPDAETLKRRQEQCLISRSPTVDDIPNLYEVARPRLVAVDRYAAFVRAQVDVLADRRAALTTALAQAASRRLWDQDLPGGEWKKDHVDPCPPCGLGRVGMSSRMFLEFYTAQKR